MTSKAEEQLEITRIEKSPFNYAKTDKGSYITCGKVVLEFNKTKEEAIKYIEQKPYEIIAMLCQAITNEMLNDKK